jgi:hypothetical protein
MCTYTQVWVYLSRCQSESQHLITYKFIIQCGNFVNRDGCCPDPIPEYSLEPVTPTITRLNGECPECNGKESTILVSISILIDPDN